MKNNYLQEHPILPFIDLPPINLARCKSGRTKLKRPQYDEMLRLMIQEVTLTSCNEMPIVGPYVGELPKNIVGFNRTSNISDPSIAPHFFFEDMLIHRYWNNMMETEAVLSRFNCSISMDFSMTNEMSRAQKMYSSFLNKLETAWLQSRGHNVIPNISFPDEYQQDYWVEGWPKCSIIALSSVGVFHHGDIRGWLKAVDRIREELQPLHIIRYGAKVPGEIIENCSYFANDNNRSANGWK